MNKRVCHFSRHVPLRATYTPFLTGQLKQGMTLSFWKNYSTKVTTALYTMWALRHLLE
jgi:hypothetical protein